MFKKDSTTIVNGEVIKTPAKYIRFIKTAYGGQFETSDPEAIEYLRKQPQFREGLIVEVKDIDKLRAKVVPERVVVGMAGTGAKAPQEPAAPEPQTPPAPVAVKVPVAAGAEGVDPAWNE